MGGERKITIRDVATAAGVSTGTVSRVLNGVGDVKPRIRKAVEEAIRALDYVPNATAQAMRSRSSNAICCILREITIVQLAGFVRAAGKVMEEAGYRLLLSSSEGKPAREMELLKRLINGQADGVMIGPYSRVHGEFESFLRSVSDRVVLIDRNEPKWMDRVTIDHAGGIRTAVGHLLSIGHRRIAMITGPEGLFPADERVKGYRLAHEDAGQTVDETLIRREGFSADSGFRIASVLLGSANRPTAIVAGGLDMLPGVLRAVRAMALTIPGDLSVVGMGATDLSELYQPPISVVSWDQDELGRLATTILLDRINGRAAPEPQHITIPTSYILRGSCAAPADTSAKAP